MGWLDAHEYLLMEAVARERVDDLRGALDLALANADAEPICEACKGPMEPIPPVGWFCLGGHEERVARHAAHTLAAASPRARPPAGGCA